MVTPPKLPANDSLPPMMRTAVVRSGLLAVSLVIALSLPSMMPSGAARSEAAKETQCRTLIELKLSANAQFQDRPGACKLIETAVSRGDQTMAQRLADCRAN